jgi:hypothetical protein
LLGRWGGAKGDVVADVVGPTGGAEDQVLRAAVETEDLVVANMPCVRLDLFSGQKLLDIGARDGAAADHRATVEQLV